MQIKISVQSLRLGIFIVTISLLTGHYQVMGKFISPDPKMRQFAHASPYGYAANNPILYIDRNGENPAYNVRGEFLGTDDRGLQGNPLIMNSSSFVQGESHDEAIQKDLGLGSLDNYDQFVRMATHLENLKNRPDWDGFVTIDEGVAWAKSHPNLKANPEDNDVSLATPDDYLYLDAAKLDFGNLKVSDFYVIGAETNSYISLLRHTDFFSSTSRSTTYTLGRSHFALLNKEGQIKVLNGPWNAYDWDYDWRHEGAFELARRLFRNTLLFQERVRHGLDDSHGFPVLFYGTGQLRKPVQIRKRPEVRSIIQYGLMPTF